MQFRRRLFERMFTIQVFAYHEFYAYLSERCERQVPDDIMPDNVAKGSEGGDREEH